MKSGSHRGVRPALAIDVLIQEFPRHLGGRWREDVCKAPGYP